MQNRQNKCTRILKHVFCRISRMIYRYMGITVLIFAGVSLIGASDLDARSKDARSKDVGSKDTRQGSFDEYQVKAVFLYNLTNFVTWPADAFESTDSSFKICILGADPFADFLDKLVENEKVNGKKIVVKQSPDIKDICGCQILFAASATKEHLWEIFSAVENCNVLTVGDMEGFAEFGGVINLIRRENRVHIEINMASAKKAGLVISSKLLKLAEIIKNRRKVEEQ